MYLYIDPGMGSMLIQAIVGAVAAGSAFFYMFRQKIAAWFGRSSKKNAIEETEKEDREESPNNK